MLSSLWCVQNEESFSLVCRHERVKDGINVNGWNV